MSARGLLSEAANLPKHQLAQYDGLLHRARTYLSAYWQWLAEFGPFQAYSYESL